MSEHNRTEAAKALLTEIEAWCARTGSRATTIGHVLFLHPGFVGLMRRRLTLSVDKELAVRQFIYHDHPNGWSGELPDTFARGARPVKRPPSGRIAKICLERGALPTAKLSDAEIAARRIDRDPCPRCGVRGDIGCAHSGAMLGTSF